MGTIFSIDVRSPGVDTADLDDVLRWLHWADETFSTYRPSSEICRLQRGELHLRHCAPEVQLVLERCDELQRETNGYFSVAGPTGLDPSGYVKGWAIQRASVMLAAAGSVNHCVNGGGDVQCVGESQPGRPWRIGIAHPFRREDVIGIAVGNRLAVATSGTTERGDHIFNPLQPGTTHDIVSLTLIGRHLEEVDAYATAAFAMGTNAVEWIESLPGYQAIVVYRDGSEWSSVER